LRKKALIKKEELKEINSLTSAFHDLSKLSKEINDADSIMELLHKKGRVEDGIINSTLGDFTDRYKNATPAILEAITKSALKGYNVELWFKLIWRFAPAEKDEIRKKYMQNIEKLALLIERRMPEELKNDKFMQEIESIFAECN